MNDITWTLVAILYQIVYAVSLAGLIRMRFTLWVKHLALAGGILLFGCTVFWYTMGWIDGMWQLDRGDDGFAEWLITSILAHVVVSGIMAAASWSMVVGTVIAASSRLDQNGIIRPHPNSLFAWAMELAGIRHTNICAISWLIGGVPVLTVWLILLMLVFFVWVGFMGILLFIISGVKPWAFWRSMLTSEPPDLEILGWGKLPIIPSIPLLAAGFVWLFFLFPTVAVLAVLGRIALAVAIIASLAYGVYRLVRWIVQYREIRHARAELQAPIVTLTARRGRPIRMIVHETVSHLPRFRVEPLWRVIVAFFQRIAGFLRDSWEFLGGLKTRFCPMVIPDETLT